MLESEDRRSATYPTQHRYMHTRLREEKIVAIGGGTGTYAVLMGVKRLWRDITAVVTMADDGGSSGRLRDEFGHLPPGDTRRCLVALSADRRASHTLRALFEYRFAKGDGLSGHAFGNLFLTALTEITGSLELAIIEASRLLNVRGRVLPVTTDDVTLCATLEDGTLITGECNIDVRTVKPELAIRQVFLSPEGCAYPPVIHAIREADILILGPGDLYSSIIPNLLVKGICEAVRDCRGTRIFVCNLMTKHGETDGFAASRFVSEIYHYLGAPTALDWVILNSSAFPEALVAKYSQEDAHPVVADLSRDDQFGHRIALEDVLASGSLLRHDPKKLADVIMKIALTARTATNQSGAHPAAVLEHTS